MLTSNILLKSDINLDNILEVVHKHLSGIINKLCGTRNSFHMLVSVMV